MIRLFYTKEEVGGWFPVDIKDNNLKNIIAVCGDKCNWIYSPEDSTQVKTALLRLKCMVFSKELLKMIDTELLVVHSLLFPDDSIWDSYYRTIHIYGVGHYQQVKASWQEREAGIKNK